MSMNGTVARIAANEAKALIDRGEAVVLDVREPREVRMTGRVPGAINIPMAQFLARTDPASPSREPALTSDKAVILYCASGQRSHIAGAKMIEFGYRTVYNLGGLRMWQIAGLPVDVAAE